MPDIKAKVLVTQPDQAGFVTWRSFLFEVFDLPAFLPGDDERLALADELRAVAIHEAAAALTAFAASRMPKGRANLEDIAGINDELGKMAGAMAEATAVLRDAEWWIESENRLAGAAAYNRILEAARQV